MKNAILVILSVMLILSLSACVDDDILQNGSDETSAEVTTTTEPTTTETTIEPTTTTYETTQATTVPTTADSTTTVTEEPTATPTIPNTVAPPIGNGEGMVYIPTLGGTRYHRREDSCGMLPPVLYVTVSEALAQGFTACGRCY
jgi:hypothetical protein